MEMVLVCGTFDIVFRVVFHCVEVDILVSCFKVG